MELKELVVRNRSYRRFYQDHPIATHELRELVELARLSASGANLQAIKYILTNTPEQNDRVFPTLRWAGYLKDWPGPEEGERPSAYVVQLLDRKISRSCACDHGIAAQSILLGAVEKGLGGCIFQNIDLVRLRQTLKLAEHYEILQVIALGKAKEEVRIVPLGEDGSIRYYRDAAAVHYVPKRSLDELIIPCPD